MRVSTLLNWMLTQSTGPFDIGAQIRGGNGYAILLGPSCKEVGRRGCDSSMRPASRSVNHRRIPSGEGPTAGLASVAEPVAGDACPTHCRCTGWPGYGYNTPFRYCRRNSARGDQWDQRSRFGELERLLPQGDLAGRLGQRCGRSARRPPVSDVPWRSLGSAAHGRTARLGWLALPVVEQPRVPIDDFSERSSEQLQSRGVVGVSDLQSLGGQ